MLIKKCSYSKCNAQTLVAEMTVTFRRLLRPAVPYHRLFQTMHGVTHRICMIFLSSFRKDVSFFIFVLLRECLVLVYSRLASNLLDSLG